MANPTFTDAPLGDDELAVGLAGLPSAPVPAIKEPGPVPTVRWLTDKKRVESHPLEFPFELDGVEYRVITIKRLTGAEVSAFMEKMRAKPDAGHRFPLYYVGDVEVSDAAWATLDDDDKYALTEIAADFLPARFRQPTENPPS